VTARFIDLFCGIGGMRLAFEANRCKCVFSCEWDKYARQTHEANFGVALPGGILLLLLGGDRDANQAFADSGGLARGGTASRKRSCQLGFDLGDDLLVMRRNSFGFLDAGTLLNSAVFRTSNQVVLFVQDRIVPSMLPLSKTLENLPSIVPC
jgi:site-specific DNA-cytosine methylase